MAKIPIKKLGDLCHRVGTAYRAGLDVKTIWEREAEQGSPRHKIALRKVADQIGMGRTVAEGMEAADGYFPELAIAVTEAGEQGGRLERSFQLLSEHYGTITRFRREMQSRLAWPLMELAGAIFIIGALILIMGWVSEKPIDWLGFGWSTRGYFWSYVACVCLFFSGLFVLVFGTKAGWFGDVPMEIARKIPVLGKTIQIFSLARFAWVLSAAYEAGMNTMRGVALAFRSTQNHYYQQFEEQVTDQLQEGQELTAALQSTGAFPIDFITRIENGELTGELPESMNRVAEEYTAEAEHNLSIIAKVMFFMVFGIIAVFIGFLIVRLWSMYLSGLSEFGSI